MKILLVNHGKASEWGGGDGVQIKETAKRLRQRGYEVDTINNDVFSACDYDLVHIFNCRVTTSFSKQIESATNSNKPIVVSPIWVSIGRALWGSRASFGILKQFSTCQESQIEDYLLQLRQRTLTVQIDDTRLIESHGCIANMQAGMSELPPLLSQSHALLPNSWLELHAVKTDLHWPGKVFDVAHYGVDPSVFLDPDPNHFIKYTGIKGQFVLQAGRIEPAKNQAMLCWALKNEDITVVLIGSSQHWPGYAELCKKILGSRLIILDHLPQQMLASAYAAASVHILPSWMETCGLVTLEASLAGTPVIGSSFGHELEYLQNDAWYCDPADPKSIQEAIYEAIKAGRNNRRSLNLKKRILEEFNWERSVDSTERIYNKVTNEIS